MTVLAHVKAQNRDITASLLRSSICLSRRSRIPMWAMLFMLVVLPLLARESDVQAASPSAMTREVPIRQQLEPLQFSAGAEASDHGPWQRVEGQFSASSSSGSWTWAPSALKSASFALVPSDSALVLLTLPAGARDGLTLEWVVGGQLERELLPGLPGLLPDSLKDLRLRLMARAKSNPSQEAQASLALTVWPANTAQSQSTAERTHSWSAGNMDADTSAAIPSISFAFAVGNDLLVRVPPGPGVLRGTFTTPSFRARGPVQAWEAAPEQSPERWWGFDAKLEQWIDAWPTQLVPPTPPQPIPAAWTELQLWSQAMEGEAIPEKLAQPLLQAMAQQILLMVRRPSTSMYQVTDITAKVSKKMRSREGFATQNESNMHAQRWVPGESQFYLSLNAGDEVTLPLDGEGVAEISVMARLQAGEEAGVIGLTMALGQAPEMPMVLRSRAGLAEAGGVLRSVTGEPLSIPRTFSRVVRPADGMLRVQVADPILLGVRFYSPSPTLFALNEVPTQRGLLDSILNAPHLPSDEGQPVPWMRGMALALEGSRRAAFLVLKDEIPNVSSRLQVLLAVQCALLAPDVHEAEHLLELAFASMTPEMNAEMILETNAKVTPEMTAQPWKTWLEGTRITLAGLRGDTAKTWKALEQDSGDSLPALTQGVMPILVPEWRAEWQRDRLSTVLASLYEQQPGSRDTRQALTRRISSESRWKPLIPEKDHFQIQRDMWVNILTPIALMAQDACTQAAATQVVSTHATTAQAAGNTSIPSSRTLYQSLPKRFPLDVTIPGPPGWESSETPVRHSVRFYLASMGSAVQVSVGIDGHWRTLSPLRSLERFELMLTPGQHRIQWESAWPVQLLMEQLPGTSLVVNPLPDGTETVAPSQKIFPCEGLHSMSKLWSLQVPQTFDIPESSVAGFARIEVREAILQTHENIAVVSSNEVQMVDVQVGNSVYSVRYQRGTALPAQLHDRGHRFLLTDAARLIVPIPAGTHQLRVTSTANTPGAVSANRSLLTQVSILAPEGIQSSTVSEKEAEVAVLKVTQPADQLNSSTSFEESMRLRELSRISNALRETPADKRGPLHLARGERLAALQQPDLAELELIAALVRGVTYPERTRAHALLRELGTSSKWQDLSWHVSPGYTGSENPFKYGQEPLLSLPDDPDPAELDLGPVWKEIKAEKWQAARRHLERLALRFPSAWKLLWIRVHVLRELGATVEEARAWSNLALRSPHPGPLWVEAARAYARALEMAAPSEPIDAYPQPPQELDQETSPHAERDRWALEGYAAASQAALAGNKEGEQLRARLGRYSRWRSLQHVERSAGVETLELTVDGMERGLRARVQEALLGVPWPASEGVIADAQTLASASLRFQHDTAVRLDLFCTFEGGVENDQGDQRVTSGPCEASVKVDGEERVSATVPVGQLRRLDLGTLRGRHTLEITLEDATLDRRLAVRVWSEQGGAVASRPSSTTEALSGDRPVGWNAVAVTPRRKGFVASALEPLRLTLEGPNWLQLEGRRRIAAPSLSDQNLLGLEVRMRSVATGDILEKEPQTGPSPMDPTARLEGRVRSQVGSPVRMEFAIPAGVWEIVVVPTQRAIVSMRVREMLAHIEPVSRMNSPLEPVPGPIERKTMMTFLKPPPSLQMPPRTAPIPLTVDIQLSAISTQSLHNVFLSEDASTEESEKTVPSSRATTTDALLEDAQVEAVDWTLTGRIRHHSEREGGIVPQWSSLSALIQGKAPFLALEGAGSEMQPSVKGMGLRLQYVYPLMNRHLRLTGEHSLFGQYQSGDQYQAGSQYQSDTSGGTTTIGDAWGARHLSRLELSGLLRMTGSFRFRPSLGLIVRSLQVGTVFEIEDTQGAINTLDPYFLESYPVTHPNTLYLQGEVFVRPLLDVYVSFRTRISTNPILISGRDNNGDAVVQGGLERVEMRALASMLFGRIELEPQLRFETGVPDALRREFTPTMTLGTAVRNRLALGAGSRLELGADARYEVLSRDVYLGLNVGGVVHQGRGSRDALPGQERFAELQDRQDVVGAATALKD